MTDEKKEGFYRAATFRDEQANDHIRQSLHATHKRFCYRGLLFIAIVTMLRKCFGLHLEGELQSWRQRVLSSS